MSNLPATNNHLCMYIEESEIPYGTFQGSWHGYRVNFSVGEKKYGFQTSVGVRGWKDVTVTVGEMGITFE